MFSHWCYRMKTRALLVKQTLNSVTFRHETVELWFIYIYTLIQKNYWLQINKRQTPIRKSVVMNLLITCVCVCVCVCVSLWSHTHTHTQCVDWTQLIVLFPLCVCWRCRPMRGGHTEQAPLLWACRRSYLQRPHLSLNCCWAQWRCDDVTDRKWS